MSKFAQMTASLLVRKGAAAPSEARPGTPAFGHAVPQSEPVLELVPPPPPPLRHDAQHRPVDNRSRAHDPEHEKRIMIWIRPEDLERLEIAAVKKGVTRHEIAGRAIDVYLRALAEDFPAPCHCVSGSCGR